MNDLAGSVGGQLTAWAAAHPRAVGYAFLIVFLAFAVTNGLRTAFRDRATRPVWVRFVLGFADPLVGNLWDVATWAAKRIGWDLRPLARDDDEGKP